MSESRIDQLTERERDCLRLVARGRSSKEIGAALGISHHTVDLYLKRAIKTLGVQDRRAAAREFEAAERVATAYQRLVTQPAPLAEPSPAPSIVPPVGPKPAPAIRVPFVRYGRQYNELGKAGRLFWILALALIFMVVVANFLNALDALYTITG